MIRRLLALLAAGTVVALGLERWLASRDGATPLRPIRSFVVVDAPPDRVWDELVDIEGQPRWMREMKAVRMLTPEPLGVGSRGEADVRILGLGVRDPVTVTVFDAPVRFAIRHEGTFKGGGVIELEPGADGTSTIVRWAETLVPPALPNLAARVQRPVLARIFQDDLLRFRDLVEASGRGDAGGPDRTDAIAEAGRAATSAAPDA